MRAYRQEELDALVVCRKVIVESPRQRMVSREGHERNDMRLRSADGEHDFSVFMRVNADFPENFTIGLRHLPREDESVTILCCNGDHGQHRNSVLDCRVISGRHIHRATDAAV